MRVQQWVCFLTGCGKYRRKGTGERSALWPLGCKWFNHVVKVWTVLSLHETLQGSLCIGACHKQFPSSDEVWSRLEHVPALIQKALLQYNAHGLYESFSQVANTFSAVFGLQCFFFNFWVFPFRFSIFIPPYSWVSGQFVIFIEVLKLSSLHCINLLHLHKL